MQTFILSITAACLLLTLAFSFKKCDHVFTNVVQPEVKANIGTSVMLPVGKQEGQEIICVKCFHRQKQVVDYGVPISESNFGKVIIASDTVYGKFKALLSGRIVDTIRSPIIIGVAK